MRRAVGWAWVASVAAHTVAATVLLRLQVPPMQSPNAPLPVMELALAGGPRGGSSPPAGSPTAAPAPARKASTAPPKPAALPKPTPIARATPPTLPPRAIPPPARVPVPARRAKPTPPPPPARAEHARTEDHTDDRTPADDHRAPTTSGDGDGNQRLARGTPTGSGSDHGNGTGAGNGAGYDTGDGSGGGGNGKGAGAATPPAPVSRVEPTYPHAARSAGIEGQVVLRAMVDVDGLIKPPVQVVRSIPELDEAAIAALNRWKFRPGHDADGQPVQVMVDVPIRFRLQ